MTEAQDEIFTTATAVTVTSTAATGAHRIHLPCNSKDETEMTCLSQQYLTYQSRLTAPDMHKQ